MTAADMRALGYRVYDAINTGNLVALEELFDPHLIRHAQEKPASRARKKQ